ncbi:MAG: glycosyltransferase family 2 protein [Gemmatimonadaceae bacterium]|nr:glycosyltransferase family 2 protein [Gemmatimonadaceae bacterium]
MPNRATLPISVVIPTYNGAATLARTIATVHAQSRLPSEIIVVDDGSKDDSALIAERLGCRVIRQQNRGLCGARNAGIAAATTPWIALLDHDDVWATTKLEHQWGAHQAFPSAVLIATDARKVTPTGDVLTASFARVDDKGYERLPVDEQSGNYRLHRAAADNLHQCGWFLLPSAVLARRDILLDVGAFDERVARNEDVCCFLRMLMQGPLAFVDDPLTDWVIHGENTHLDERRMVQGRLALLDVALGEPAFLPPAYLQMLRDEEPSMCMRVGRLEMERGSLPDARHALGRAIAAGAGMRARAMWIATWLGPALLTRLMHVRHFAQDSKEQTASRHADGRES